MDINTKPQLFEKVYQPLVESLEKITDLRYRKGVRYKLKPFLILLFLSKLGGADRPAEIADWVKFRFLELKSLLNLEWKPSSARSNFQTDYEKRDESRRSRRKSLASI